jgi:hypothetical protein
MYQVVWGWRRSTWNEESSRLVYFSAEYRYLKDFVEMHEPRLFLIRRGSELGALEEKARKIKSARVGSSSDGFHVSIGPISVEDKQRIERLDRSRRHRIKDLSQIHETRKWAHLLQEIGRKHPRLIAYIGSGLSYEAGVPTLATMHKLFGVDNGPGTEFCLGTIDPLIDSLNAKTYSWFVGRVRTFQSACARARPSLSHQHLRRAYRRGQISSILTDNVDDIFERRLGIPALRTRGDGLTSERYAGLDEIAELVQSGPHVLLVIGVSADRRCIIETLGRLIPTVVVNPAQPVSPHSKNLDYLDQLGFDEEGNSKYGHVFIKQPSRKCLGRVVSCLCG